MQATGDKVLLDVCLSNTSTSSAPGLVSHPKPAAQQAWTRMQCQDHSKELLSHVCRL